MKGTIFSIEEFAVFDGDGVRVNVFFKGCPLRCKWCHNPEGLSTRRQIVHSPNGCLSCGKCRSVCSSPEACIACGACILACPRHLIRFSGDEWEAGDLAKRLLRFLPILARTGGGVTFSGGEVLLQPDFLLELLEKTRPMHRAIETCGYAPKETFAEVLNHVDFVFYDLKLMDPARHKYYTGVSNAQILENAKLLMDSEIPHIFRVPLIHGVNTDSENLQQLHTFLSKAKDKQSVEFLMYNRMAGAKYKMLGMEYGLDFESPTEEDCQRARDMLVNCNVRFRI